MGTTRNGRTASLRPARHRHSRAACSACCAAAARRTLPHHAATDDCLPAACLHAHAAPAAATLPDDICNRFALN